MQRNFCWEVDQVALQARFELRPKNLPSGFDIRGGVSDLRDGLKKLIFLRIYLMLEGS